MSTKQPLTGWRRQRPDPRDLHYLPPRRVRLAQALSVDLSQNMGVQLNQDQLGSCGPNTADELIQYDQKVQGLPVIGASRLFIYYNTRVIMGTVGQDSGVDNRSMMQALANQGFCPESAWPYNESQYTTKPPPAAYAAALLDLVTSYAAVAQNLSAMQATLASGFPFMFGFDCFNQIMSDQAAANGILTDPTGSVIGGHDVSICGYNATTSPLPGVKSGNQWPAGFFKFRNHWMNDATTPWGDGGYGYVSFAYATGLHASDFWVINALPGGDRPGPPSPVPPSPVPPIPPGPTGQQIQAVVDAVFAQLEKAHPFLAPLLRQVQAYVDAALVHQFGGQAALVAKLAPADWIKLIMAVLNDVLPFFTK
jgi:hypothetical protein